MDCVQYKFFGVVMREWFFNTGNCVQAFTSFYFLQSCAFCAIHHHTGAELFISGESYAGFYVPWIAEHIVKMQLVPNEQGVLVRDTTIGEYTV